MLIVVLLPAPLGPKKATSLFSYISNEISSTAGISPKLFVNPVTAMIPFME